MKSNQEDIIEAAAKWLNSAGFEDDLSALTAGLHDTQRVMDKISGKLLPALIALGPAEKDKALEIIVELWVEMRHVGQHAGSAENLLTKVRDFLDES